MDKNCDKKEAPPEIRSPRIGAGISINVTDADSPSPAVRRRVHLRSLSDVTPSARSPAVRARSHSDRPRVSLAPASSPAHSPIPSPARSPAPARVALQPRAVCSERSSPDASSRTLAEGVPVRPEIDPWRKMSEADLASAARRGRGATRASLDAPRDPWVRVAQRAASRDSLTVAAAATSAGAGAGANARRARLQRAAAVTCAACGAGAGAGCECWRCTCSPRRPPPRALSDSEERPRRLYKSSSQKVICATEPRVDPLLETTC